MYARFAVVVEPLAQNNKTYGDMFYECIFICMRITLNIDDRILRKATKITGVKEKASLVRLGLEALVSLESTKRLASLGGTEKRLRFIPRRRS